MDTKRNASGSIVGSFIKPSLAKGFLDRPLHTVVYLFLPTDCQGLFAIATKLLLSLARIGWEHPNFARGQEKGDIIRELASRIMEIP